MKSYLKRHLFDGERLRRRTMEEFAVALRSGRLIAFVGSYATRDVRYPDWKDFLNRYVGAAERLVVSVGNSDDPQKQKRAAQGLKAIQAIEDTMPGTGTVESEKAWDNALTSLSVVEQVLAYVEEPSSQARLEFQKEIGHLFDLKPLPLSRSNVDRIAALRVDRVITLNYDLEFEWHWMTTAGEKRRVPAASRTEVFEELRTKGWIVACDDDSLMRILADGRSVISDNFVRGRTDRLIEFAVGSPDYEAHILHLHGLAVAPETMVIGQWDYNRRYRRSGISKLPFEHGLRVLFAGNPILFIGVGTTERDVTATLEQIVSDHPDRRITPAFILWNAPPASKLGEPFRCAEHEKEAFRFRWLHRFGVLTIFDDEILPATWPRPTGTDEERFSQSIDDLAERAVALVRPFDWETEDLRTIAVKLKNPANIKSGHYDIWPPAYAGQTRARSAALACNEHEILLFIGRPGLGKGRLARRLRDAWHRSAGKDAHSMIINASFVFEIESVFSLISGLGDGRIAMDEEISRRQSLANYFEKPSSARVLVVINGMERFFSPTGQPLSTELDGLLRSIVRGHHQRQLRVQAVPDPARGSPPPMPPFQIAILGTSRVRAYFDALHIEERERGDLIDLLDLNSPLIRQLKAGNSPARSRQLKVGTLAAQMLPSKYFSLVQSRFNLRGVEATKIQGFLIEDKSAGDPAQLRRHFLATFLQTEALDQAHVADPDLCFDILTVMAYIGQPIEDAVLFHAPRIQKRLATIALEDPPAQARALRKAIEDLRRLALIQPRWAFESSPKGWGRYGLHRSVLTELRDRVGVPLSDSKLSSGFNISLFAAQPVEGYSPEAEIHEELDMLVDWLIGAYKDQSLDEAKSGSDTAALRQARATSNAAKQIVDQARAEPHVSACLRAALALVRNYYSTSALLTLDPSEQNGQTEKDGPLAQHAERLDRLIAAAIDSARARREPRRLSRHGYTARAKLGPAPFYGDDLVWLYNERGVVKLAQGDLYEARHSFDEALRLNGRFVEFKDCGNNWRHLMLNQLHVDIERARLDRAEQRMGEIERSIGDEIKRSIGETFERTKAYVVHRYGRKVSSKPYVVDPVYEHDVILTIGLLYGYRGLCLHLGGEYKLASEMFQVAVNILENIGEQRAYAMFQRFFGSLKAALGQTPEALEAFKVAIASSEATRQTDIANHARIAEAWHSQRSAKSESGSRAMLIRRLQRSLRYAEAGEMHRVRVEAGLNLARIKFDGGDYDSALERVADALATATRYGMSLRKISLRILMGQILMRRGDHKSGASLIERAMRNADRVGYQGAVGLAQRVQALEENPAAAPQL